MNFKALQLTLEAGKVKHNWDRAMYITKPNVFFWRMNTYEGEMCHKPNAIESDLHYHFVGPASTECYWHIAGSS